MEDFMKNIGCIILAAGQGTRFGKQKQFVEFNGKTLWKHIYDKACMLIKKRKYCSCWSRYSRGKH